MPSTTEGVLLSCHDLEIGYGGSALLPPVSLEIRRGEHWAVIGRNGSGKSTWLRTVLGLIPKRGGEVRLGPDLRLAYLGQRQSFDDLYPVLARDVVAMGLERGWSAFRLWSRDSSGRVAEALRLVGAEALADKPFRELSEGQKQRVLFARVAVGKPDLAVLDEPTSAMDLVAEREAYEVLRALQRATPITLVVVSHYLGLAREYADHALLLDPDTPAVVAGTPQQIFEHASFRRHYGEPGTAKGAHDA